MPGSCPISLFLLLGVALLQDSAADASADRVTDFPDFDGTLPSPQYSGYLDIAGGKHIHYMLSMSEAGTDSPVVFWLNGGPGCSSLGGYFQEHGPLHFREQTSLASGLAVNPWRWSRRAHVMYTEHPAGVGFSWADSPSGYDSNDTSAATDMAHVVAAFFDKFPALAGNDFYIAGESYAGVYVPTSAAALFELEPAVASALRGVMVGNPCVGNDVPDGCAFPGHVGTIVEFLATHAIVDPGLFARASSLCGDYSLANITKPLCAATLLEGSKAVGPVNIYDVIAECDTYAQTDDDVVGARAVAAAGEAALRVGGADAARQFGSIFPYGPQECFDAHDGMTEYLNEAAVQEALHIAAAARNVTWADCDPLDGPLHYRQTAGDLTKAVWPSLLQQHGLRGLVYSGDVDSCVPYTGTQRWTQALGEALVGEKQRHKWRPWMVDSQVAGYVQAYDTPGNFTFATVKGAGHMVPEFQPKTALALFERFLAGGPL